MDEPVNEKVNEILAQFTKDRANLIPILQKVQNTERYLSENDVKEISRFLDLTENDIYSVASFYSQFRFNPPGTHIIKVCLCPACHMQGSSRILESVEQELKVRLGETTGDSKFTLERVVYSGCPGSAPVMVIDQDTYTRMTPEKVKEVLARYS
ncbi:MAG: hypothetical protein A2144_14615 [Chloroflexi bacterium RBG_16_50_9]|nr:MAG: hypothetical protein A2144_14615 [Chloroflexi bacterium RBG_16_50_9]